MFQEVVWAGPPFLIPAKVPQCTREAPRGPLRAAPSSSQISLLLFTLHRREPGPGAWVVHKILSL